MKISALVVLCTALVLAPALRSQPTLNQTPSRVVGQLQLEIKTANPNLVEGRELLAPEQVALDNSTSPPALYVADTGNNRVLGWRDAATFANGAMADVVLGQPDKASTFSLGGSGSARPGGLNRPTGVAVDGAGNVYVFDAGNNRILRFRTPLASNSDQTADMVIGQSGFSTTSANTGGVSARSLASNGGSGVANSPLAFDPQGNLYAVDYYNNRVLRYPAAALSANRNGPDADIVLGQPNFVTTTALTASAESRTNKSGMNGPAGLAVDAAGRVYVGDSLARVLVYVPGGPMKSSQPATRIMGLSVYPAGTAPGSIPRANQINTETPEGVFLVGDRPAVVDRTLNRVLIFPPVAQWPAETPDALSPQAIAVIGQLTYADFLANQNQPKPTAATLALPVSGVATGDTIFISDSGNNRVLAFPANGTTATRVLGQDAMDATAPNLLEGRELYVFGGLSPINGGGNFTDGAGIAIDKASSAPHLYIADTYNNRILAYRDARRVRAGDKADLILGQTDARFSLANSPSNDPTTPTPTGFYLPSDVAVDANGALWVADSGNGRVLRFRNPFDALDNGRSMLPDLVLGQSSFSTRQVDPTSRIMGRPFGLAFSVDGSLAVSDAQFNRVLFFRKPAGGDFSIAQAAEKVIGQPDFLTGGLSQGTKRFFSPRHISMDGDDRLYVADAGNNRVAIFNRITDPREPSDPFPVVVIGGLNSPQVVYADRTTNTFWVGEPSQSRALHFPVINLLGSNPQPDFQVATAGPLAMTMDSTGALYIADAANRVAMYYNAAVPVNTASGNDQFLAPDTIASIYPVSATAQFGTQTASASSLPYPTDLADIQVFVQDQPAPLIYVSPGQINFIVPWNAPASGVANYLVVQKSTGQVLGSGQLQMNTVAPALFTLNQAGTGQVAALNQDNTVNGPSNPIAWGQVIQLFGTGQGVVSGAPPDGEAVSSATPTDDKPEVLIGSDFVPQSAIEYSGLAPGIPGVWQINVRIPTNTVTGNAVDIVIRYRTSWLSNRGKANQTLKTTIAVKQS